MEIPPLTSTTTNRSRSWNRFFLPRNKSNNSTKRRLATEHALLDDNGDGLGSRAEWFEGTTPTQAPSDTAEPDGDLANQKVLVKNAFERLLSTEQRNRRDGLERKVVELRRSKASLDEKTYYQQLETALLELARLYEEVKKHSSTQ